MLPTSGIPQYLSFRDGLLSLSIMSRRFTHVVTGVRVSSSNFFVVVKLEREVPWLVWLSGMSTGLQTKGSQVQFPVRAHAWVVGQVPSRGSVRGNHTLMFPPLSPSLPLSLKTNE